MRREPPQAAKRDLIEIRLMYQDFSSGAAMEARALELAKKHEPRLLLEDYGVRKVKNRATGEYAVFTFRKAPAPPVAAPT